MSNTQRGEGEEEEVRAAEGGGAQSVQPVSFLLSTHKGHLTSVIQLTQEAFIDVHSQVSHLYVSSFFMSTENCSVCESAAGSTQQLLSLYNRLYCIVGLQFCQRETFNSVMHPQV